MLPKQTRQLATLMFTDVAFHHLDEGVGRRDSSLLFVRTSVRGWGGVREDPRFQDLLRKMGLIE